MRCKSCAPHTESRIITRVRADHGAGSSNKREAAMDRFRKMVRKSSTVSPTRRRDKSPQSPREAKPRGSPRGRKKSPRAAGEQGPPPGPAPATQGGSRGAKERSRAMPDRLPAAAASSSSSSSGPRLEKQLLDALTGTGVGGGNENVLNSAFLNQLQGLLPLLQSSHHESGASRPKLLLETLNMKTKVFTEEISAVRLQRLWRGARGRMYTKQLRLVSSIKDNLAVHLTALLADELVVGEVMALSRDLLGTEVKHRDMREAEEANFQRALETVLSEELGQQVPRLVKECIREEANEYLNRKKMLVKNPLLRIIFDVCDEAVSELLPEVAQVAVNESVEAFLLQRRGEKAFGYIAMELFSDEFPSLLEEALAEADLEIAVDGVLDEVMVEMLTQDTEEALAGLEKDKRIAVRQDDMRIIGGHLLEGMAKRMLLGHLMMSIANNFEEVLLEHQSRAVVRRFIAHRLLKLVTEADTAIKALKENKVSREVYMALSSGTLQEMCVDAMVERSRDVLDDVDAQEARLAGKWAREARSRDGR